MKELEGHHLLFEHVIDERLAPVVIDQRVLLDVNVVKVTSGSPAYTDTWLGPFPRQG
jgi:hypothetical protein